jgi:hypothetical protein
VNKPQNEETIWTTYPGSEWLTKLDTHLALEIFVKSHFNNFLEIGVWKGAWSFSILGNFSTAEGCGVDPYPGFDFVEENLIRDVAKYGFQDRFKMYKTTEALLRDIKPSLKFDLIHIDGEHSQKAIERDLKVAADLLSDSGVIIVDDYRDQHFPGVAAGVFNFLNSSDFASFCLTPNKMYICRTVSYSDCFQRILDYCRITEADFENEFKGTLYGNPYAQENSIHGFQQILIFGDRRTYYSYESRHDSRKWVKTVILLLTPPLLVISFKKSLSLFKGQR